jgi:hypothetical protein
MGPRAINMWMSLSVTNLHYEPSSVLPVIIIIIIIIIIIYRGGSR